MTSKAVTIKKWESEMKLVKSMCASTATDAEFGLFCYMAKKYNLDPLVKEIWLIKYNATAAPSIFAGRDGFLKIAHESGLFDGMETFSVDNEGKEVATTSKNKLTGAICRVYKKGIKMPFIVAVSLAEYNTNKSSWAKMPETMIKKVAESQCLRKAFSVHGIYSPEEMDQEQQKPQKPQEPQEPITKSKTYENQPQTTEREPNNLITEAQRRKLYAMIKDAELDGKEFLSDLGYKSSKDIPFDKVNDVFDAINQYKTVKG